MKQNMNDSNDQVGNDNHNKDDKDTTTTTTTTSATRIRSECHVGSKEDHAAGLNGDSHNVDVKFVELGDPILIAVRHTLDLKYEQSLSCSSSSLLKKTINGYNDVTSPTNDQASSHTNNNNQHQQQQQQQNVGSRGKKALIPSDSLGGKVFEESEEALRMFSPCSVHPVDSAFQKDHGISKDSYSYSSTSPVGDNDRITTTCADKDFFSPALYECKASTSSWSPKRKNLLLSNNNDNDGQQGDICEDGGKGQSDDEIRSSTSASASASRAMGCCTTPVKSEESKKQQVQNRNYKCNYNDQSVDMAKELKENVTSDQRNNVLVSCSSFTQHDFTPQKPTNNGSSGNSSCCDGDVHCDNLGDDQFVSNMATLYWRQMVARWKHDEMMQILIAKPTSHHFTKHRRSKMYFEQVKGRLDNTTVSCTNNSVHGLCELDYLNFILDWERALSSDWNNLNGFCPSKLLYGPEIPRISNYLQALGRLPKCIAFVPDNVGSSGRKDDEKTRKHIWPGIDDSMDVLRQDVSKFKLVGGEKTNNLKDALDYLEKLALDSQDQFMKSVSDIVKFASKQSDTPSIIKSNIGMKTRTSIVEKARRKYGGDILQVKDILRGRIVFPDESSMISALVHLHKTSDAQGSHVSTYKLVRLKNLFRTSSFGNLVPSDLPTGYRHVLVNLRMPNGCLTELQFNLKHMFDLLGESGYQLHNELIKCEKWSRPLLPVPPQVESSMNRKYVKYLFCTCAQEAPKVFRITGVRGMATNYLDNMRHQQRQLPQRRLSLDFCDQTQDMSTEKKTSSCDDGPLHKSKNCPTNYDESFRSETLHDKESCDNDLFIFSFDKIQEWLGDSSIDHNGELERKGIILDSDVQRLSDLECSQFLVNSACKDIEATPHDIALYICLHRIYRDRYRITKLDFDRDNALKALSTCIEIIDSSNAKGMVGWLGYGKSNLLDRSLNIPFETYSELAYFYAATKEWKSVYRVLASLVLRCEHNLPLYHPNTIAALLDLAAASSENGDSSKAVKFSARAISRLKFYLDEQEQACAKILQMNSIQMENKKASVLRHFGLDHIQMMRAFVTHMNMLVNRKFLAMLHKNHPMKLLFLRLVGDSFSSFATILRNASHSLDNMEHEAIDLRSESHTAWMMASKYYKRALEGCAKDSNIYHADILSLCSCFAHSLKQLGRLSQAVKLLSSYLDSFLDTARNRSSSVDDLGTYSTLSYTAKRYIITCVWQLAMYTVEYKVNGDGRLDAIELLNIGIDYLVHALQPLEERFLKVLQGDLERLMERQFLTCKDAKFDTKDIFVCV